MTLLNLENNVSNVQSLPSLMTFKTIFSLFINKKTHISIILIMRNKEKKFNIS